jgi:RNA polymerase sigma-70 factor (ECF subfamily)
VPLYPPAPFPGSERLDSLTSVYLRERDALMSTLASRTGSREVARDLLHEVWLRIAQLRELPAPDNPKAFLRRVAGNLAVDWLRRNRFVSRFHDLEVDPTIVPESSPDLDRALAAREAVNHMRDLVGRLPAKQREVFLLCQGQALTVRAAAERIGISPRTAEAHYAKAVGALRRGLVEARLWP